LRLAVVDLLRKESITEKIRGVGYTFNPAKSGKTRTPAGVAIEGFVEKIPIFPILE